VQQAETTRIPGSLKSVASLISSAMSSQKEEKKVESTSTPSVTYSELDGILRKEMAKRILILDGAMGTMIQKHTLAEEDFRDCTLLCLSLILVAFRSPFCLPLFIDFFTLFTQYWICDWL
jgi:hypothetical protein